jgi:uncharacterized protein YigE (DUF2233 family)
MRKSLIYTSLAAGTLLLGVGVYYFTSISLKKNPFGSPKNSKHIQAETLHYRNQGFDVVKVNPKEIEIRLFWKDEAGNPYGSFDALAQGLAQSGKTLRFATNAGIFSEDHTPGGLHIEDGHELKSLNLREGGGNFHMKPNGVFVLGAEGADVVESQQFQTDKPDAMIATQSGPMLVIDGNLHPAFREGSENKFIRNGVGVDDEGNIWFAISNERVNFYDFAMLFRDRLHCPEALYLDGSISGFYSPELNRNDAGAEFCGILAVVE